MSERQLAMVTIATWIPSLDVLQHCISQYSIVSLTLYTSVSKIESLLNFRPKTNPSNKCICCVMGYLYTLYPLRADRPYNIGYM